MEILKNTKLLFVFNLFITLSLYAPIEVVYLKSIGFSISVISITNLLVPLVAAIMEVPTGVLGDYIGRKKTLMLSGICFLASMVMILFSEEVYQVFIAYFLEGLAWSFYSGNTDAIVVEDAIEKKSNISKQLAIFYAGLSYGPVVSGLFNTGISFFNGEVNFKFIILLSIITRIVALVFALFVEITSNNSNKDEEQTKKLSPLGIFKASFKMIRSDFFSTSIIVYEATGRLIYYLPVIVQPLLLHRGIDLIYFGIIFAALQLIQGIVQSKVDVIVDKLGKDFILKFSPVALSLGLFLFVIPNTALIILGLIIIQVVNPIRGQCIVLQKNKAISNEIRATYLSCISFSVLIVNVSFLSLVGLVLESNFIISMFILIAICLGGGFSYKKILSI